MKHKIILLLFLLSSIFCINAQKEQNNWFFGFNVGVTWNTTQNFSATGIFGTPNATLSGIPTFVSGSPMSTNEGCFSLSDLNGNLLFYSDGMTIWNKNNAVMTNGTGMAGNSSSAQSGIIFPYPNNNSRYIAVSLGAGDSNNLSYSIVNMSQSGGLGAVEIAYKNIPFTGQSGTLGESVTAVRHQNKKDFWVVAVGRGTTTSFNVWKVTEAAGVQTTLYSTISYPVTTNAVSPAGYLKFTQDGKHFVWISYFEKFFIYGDFNNVTGMMSNLRIRYGGSEQTGNPGVSSGYGVEFSPNGKYLYLSYSPGARTNTNPYSSHLFAYDFDALLAASDPNSVNPVKTLSFPVSVTSGPNQADQLSGMQLGPDNRLYISCFNSTSLFTVDNPDVPTDIHIYKLTGILKSGSVQFGLPSFAAPWFKMFITPTDATCCSETSNSYSLSFENGMGFNLISKIVIDFGDGGANSRITINNPSVTATYTYNYTYKTPGTYILRAIAFNASGGEELLQTSTMTVETCALKVNKHIRGIMK